MSNPSHIPATHPTPSAVCPRCGRDAGRLPFCPRDGSLLTPFALGERYFADQAVGAGRSTIVLAGHHAVLGRRVAFKILRPELAAIPEARAHFLAQAERTSGLRAESLLGVGDFGEDAHLGLPYVVTDFVAGPTLAELLGHTSQMPIPFVVSTLVKVARGLGAAHDASVVHGDLSPRNIVFEQRDGSLDLALICDAALSPLPEGDRAAWLAAPEYLSPEQIAAGRPFEPSADLYALGVLGYQMITGRLPHDGDSAHALVAAKLSDAPVRMPRDERTTDVPNPLRRVIERCLSFNPADRPASALEVASELVGASANARYSEPPPAPTASLIGTKIGPHRVLEKLGHGGVGEVFLAEHEVIGSQVAIKVLREDVTRIGGVVERFEQEARAASAVGDPCIPAFYDFGYLEDGRPYAIMEYLRGETVADFLERTGPISIEETQALLQQVARAMSRAHGVGIIHRDLKPENLFLMDAEVVTPSRSAVRILDFGIAKVLSPELAASTNHSHVGTFMGTPDYCAPEQIYGGDVGPRTDVYALGAIAFALLTGRPPVVASHPGEVLLHKATDPAPRVSSMRGGVPKAVDDAIDSMLQRDPSKRPADMQEVLQLLDLWDAPEDPGMTSSRPWEAEPENNQPWIPLLSLVAMVLVTAGISAAVMLSDGGRELLGGDETQTAAVGADELPAVPVADSPPADQGSPAGLLDEGALGGADRVGSEAPADTEAPAHPEAPADTEAPANIQAPADPEAPAHTEAPAQAPDAAPFDAPLGDAPRADAEHLEASGEATEADATPRRRRRRRAEPVPEPVVRPLPPAEPEAQPEPARPDIIVVDPFAES